MTDAGNNLNFPPARQARLYGIAGVVCAAAGLFLLTVILESLAVVLGYLAHKGGDRTLGRIGMVAGGAVLALFVILYVLALIRGEPPQQS